MKLMGETETDYKLVVALSIPKESLKDDVGSLIENCTLFSFLEVGTEIVVDSLHEQLELSPQKSIMVQRLGSPRPTPNTKKKRRRK